MVLRKAGLLKPFCRLQIYIGQHDLRKDEALKPTLRAPPQRSTKPALWCCSNSTTYHPRSKGLVRCGRVARQTGLRGMDRLLSSLHTGKGETTYYCWCIMTVKWSLASYSYRRVSFLHTLNQEHCTIRESTTSEKLVSMVMVIVKVVQ